MPRRPGIREIHELSEGDQQQLLRESSVLGKGLMEVFSGDKLNIAALGNMVPQLHLHHIVRHEGDAAWPGPVWGCKRQSLIQRWSWQTFASDFPHTSGVGCWLTKLEASSQNSVVFWCLAITWEPSSTILSSIFRR